MRKHWLEIYNKMRNFGINIEISRTKWKKNEKNILLRAFIS